MAWEEVELGEVCKIINGATPSRRNPGYFTGKINWFTPKDLSKLHGKFILESPEKITQEAYDSCSTKLIPPYSLLLTSRAPIGHIAINTASCCTNQGFKTLIPDAGKLDIDYLFYCISYNKSKIKELGRGATFKELNTQSISRFKIPLPPLATQKKIADILDTADEHRQKTKALLDKYEQLTQSIFLDMFGDPVTNPMGWEVKKLGDVCDKIGSGSTPRGGKESYKDSGISLIRSLNIHNNSFKHLNLAFIDEHQASALSNVIVEENDLLYNITGASVCRTTTVPKEILPARVNQHVAIIRGKNSRLNSSYLKHYFLSPNVRTKMYSIATAAGATREAITKGQLEELEIAMPPLREQLEFEKQLKSIENLRTSTELTSVDGVSLFNSLLQKAFKGELA